MGSELGTIRAGEVFTFCLDDFVRLESRCVMTEHLCAPAHSSASDWGTLHLGTSTWFSCVSLPCSSPSPSWFCYSEARCKPPWFLGLLLPLSFFHFSPFLFLLLSFLFFLLIGSSISWVLHPTCNRNCKKDLGRARSLRTFLQLPNTLGLLQVPEKKGLVGSPFHTTVLVAMNTCRQQLCSSSYLLSLLLSLSFYSCSSCFFTVAHMVASRSGNCWRGSRSAKLLAQVNKQVEMKLKEEQGWVSWRHAEVPNQLFQHYSLMFCTWQR